MDTCVCRGREGVHGFNPLTFEVFGSIIEQVTHDCSHVCHARTRAVLWRTAGGGAALHTPFRSCLLLDAATTEDTLWVTLGDPEPSGPVFPFPTSSARVSTPQTSRSEND